MAEEKEQPIFNESAIRNYGLFFSGDQIRALEDLHTKLSMQLKALYISSEVFLKYAMEACQRYREYNNESAAMKVADVKDFEYVKKSLFSNILESYQKTQS